MSVSENTVLPSILSGVHGLLLNDTRRVRMHVHRWLRNTDFSCLAFVHCIIAAVGDVIFLRLRPVAVLALVLSGVLMLRVVTILPSILRGSPLTS